MLEVSLGADGSVLEVVPSAEAGAPRGAPDPVIFPLDGLPQRTADSGDLHGALGSPDSWTGGFSFALRDPARRSITAYRDHYGARPLYYRAEPRRLLLASEIPAILARLPSTPDLDEVSVMEYLTTGLLTDGRTFHRRVRRLPAGSRLLAGSGTPRVERYWDPWPGPADDALSAADLEAGFRHRFREAVAATLNDAGPFGVLLSGGPDSSSVLGMAAALAREGTVPDGPRAALTMVFESLQQCDEGGPAEATARFHGVPWLPVQVEPHSPLRQFDEFLERFGEPPCSLNLTLESLLLDAARRAGIRVLLDGHDADVLFIPSERYLHELFRRLRWRRLAAEIQTLRTRHHLRAARLARALLVPFAPSLLKRLRRRAPRWLRRDMVRRTGLEEILRGRQRPARFEQAEAERVLSPSVGLALEVARCLERMHGIEGRHPFFDHRLVRYLSAIPFDRRFSAAESKLLMRRALSDLLVPAVRERVDKTNYTPYFDWSMRHHLGDDIARLAHEGSELLAPYVDWDRTRPILQSFLSGGTESRLPIWRLLALERWLMLMCGKSMEARTMKRPSHADSRSTELRDKHTELNADSTRNTRRTYQKPRVEQAGSVFERTQALGSGTKDGLFGSILI